MVRNFGVDFELKITLPKGLYEYRTVIFTQQKFNALIVVNLFTTIIFISASKNSRL